MLLQWLRRLAWPRMLPERVRLFQINCWRLLEVTLFYGKLEVGYNWCHCDELLIYVEVYQYPMSENQIFKETRHVHAYAKAMHQKPSPYMEKFQCVCAPRIDNRSRCCFVKVDLFLHHFILTSKQILLFRKRSCNHCNDDFEKWTFERDCSNKKKTHWWCLQNLCSLWILIHLQCLATLQLVAILILLHVPRTSVLLFGCYCQVDVWCA